MPLPLTSAVRGAARRTVRAARELMGTGASLELQQVRRRLVRTTEELGRDRVRLSATNEALHDAVTNVRRFEQELAASRKQVARQRTRIEGLVDRVDRLQARNERRAARAERLRDELRAARAEQRATKQQVTSLEAALSDWESRVATALDQLSTNEPRTVALAINVLREEGQANRLDHLADVLSLPGDEMRSVIRMDARSQTSLVPEQFVGLRSFRPDRSGGVALLNDTRTQNNVGCRSTSRSLHRALTEDGLSVEASVTLAELELIWRLLVRGVGFPPSVGAIDEFATAFDTLPELAPWREQLQRRAALVVNGEGSFYDRQPKGLVLCAMARWAATRGLRVAFVNQSLELGDDVMRDWVASALGSTSFVAVREPFSARVAREAAIGGVEFVPDAAFSEVHRKVGELDGWTGLHPDELFWQHVQENDNTVLVTGSSSLVRTDREPGDPWTGIEQLVLELRKQGFRPLLYAADGGMTRLLRPIAITTDCGFVSAATPVPIVRALMERSVAMVSGRWHASILASTVGLPVLLADANFFKTEALAEMLGHDWPMVEYADFEQESERIARLVVELAARPELRPMLIERATQHAIRFGEGMGAVRATLAG